MDVSLFKNLSSPTVVMRNNRSSMFMFMDLSILDVSRGIGKSRDDCEYLWLDSVAFCMRIVFNDQ